MKILTVSTFIESATNQDRQTFYSVIRQEVRQDEEADLPVLPNGAQRDSGAYKPYVVREQLVSDLTLEEALAALPEA